MSKAAADLLSYQIGLEQRLDVIRARPFNHIGPGQAADFAIASFSLQLAGIVSGRREPVLNTGNLDSAHDLSDVRDIVSAYRLLMERGRPGSVYNIASGQTYPIRDILHSSFR